MLDINLLVLFSTFEPAVQISSIIRNSSHGIGCSQYNLLVSVL